MRYNQGPSGMIRVEWVKINVAKWRRVWYNTLYNRKARAMYQVQPATKGYKVVDDEGRVHWLGMSEAEAIAEAQRLNEEAKR